MNNKLLIAVGISAGFSVLSAKAEFTGYYAINNPGPGGYNVIAQGAGPGDHPINLGNWALDSDTRAKVEFQRAPSDSSLFARSIVLTVNVNNSGNPGNGWLTIVQPTTPSPDPSLLDEYTFTYNAGLATPDNSFWYRDYDGVDKPLVGQGTAKFMATAGLGGETWGFYVRVGNATSAGVLQIQDWQQVPEPSSIMMLSFATLGIVGYGIRKYRKV